MSNTEKNPANVQTVDFSRHGKLKVKTHPGYAHAKARHLAAVNVSELGIASSNFPVVFVQNPRDQRYMLMAMLGLKGGENIYYGDEYWESTYVPMAIQRHPFVVGYDDRVQDAAQLAACIEIDSACVGEKDGIPLYNADGTSSDLLRNVQQMLGLMFEAGKFTEQFVDKLRELDLIASFDLSLQAQNGEFNRVTGMHTINEAKLKALSGEQLKDLQSRDFLAPCHLMLVSLYQLNQLIRLRNRKGVRDQVTSYRIEFASEKQAAANA
jgi:hypothetical protein